MTRYWMSWWTRQEPEHVPWPAWCTGYRAGCQRSICAIVDSPDPVLAFESVSQVYTDAEPRFTLERADDWHPSWERFALV